jgi:uncharacterized lipoprotein YmbA
VRALLSVLLLSVLLLSVLLLSVLLLSVLLLVGCLPGPHADTTRYYVLTAAPQPPLLASSLGSPASGQGPSIGLGPVELPTYLDRTELVSRPEPNRLQVTDDDRWGEPLVDGFRRVLREDLKAVIARDRVVARPFDTHSPPDLVFAIDVSRFEPTGTERRKAELVARWTLQTFRGCVIASDETVVQEPIYGQEGRTADVAALSRVLLRFADHLARAVQVRSSTACSDR